MADWHKFIPEFTGGLNDRFSSELIKDNELQTALNVDLRNGQVVGRNDVGASIATAGSASVNWIWYASGSQWIDPTTDKMGATQGSGEAVERRWALNDGAKTYFTRVGKRPHVATATYQHPLGLAPVTGFQWTSTGVVGNMTGTYGYAFTFATDEGIESNPMGFEWIGTLTGGADFQGVAFSSIPTSPDPRVTKRRIWRTQANGRILYLRSTLDDNSTTTFTDTTGGDTVLDLSTQLTWSPGGWKGSGGQYTSDHSPAPPLTVLSNTMHSVNDATGTSGSGIVFGGSGSIAYWSMLGFPDYWPVINQMALPERIEAIISHAGITFYFLSGGIYQVVGDGDTPDRISWSRTNALFGVVPGEGRSVKQTPYGIIFKSREGIALFNGSEAKILREDKINAANLRSLTVNDAAFYNDHYYLFHSTGTKVFDLTDTPQNLRVATTEHVVRCAAIASVSDPVQGVPKRPGLSLVSNIIISDGGSGYSSVPSATIGAPTSPSGTTATGSVFCAVDRVQMTAGGSGYTSVPDVTFSDPPAGSAPITGRVAKGYATISGGQIVAVTVTDPGSGYSGVPTITLTGGGGSGATTQVLMRIEKVTLTNGGGTGYDFGSSPTVSFTAPPARERLPNATAVTAPLGYRFAGLVATSTALFRIGGLYIRVNVPGVVGGDTVESTTDGYTIQTSLTGGKWVRNNALNAARYNVTPVFNGSTIYVYGGTNSAARVATLSTWETGNGTGVWTQSGAQTPGALCGYGIATDGSDYIYIYGGYNGAGTRQDLLWRYSISGATWTNLTTTTPAPADSERGDCAMVYISGKLYIVGGENASGEAQSTVLIFDTASPAWTTDTTGPTNGFTARVSCAAVAYNSKAYIYGGRSNNSNTGVPMSDLWEFDPAASTTWSRNVGSVVGVPPLARMGFAVISGRLYLFGGSTPDNLTTANLYEINLDQLVDPSTGLYVVKNSDGGEIRLWEGGSPMAWTIKTKDFTAMRMGPYLTWHRIRMECSGNLTIKASLDGGAAQTIKTLAGATRSTPQRFWLPSASGSKVKGQRVALQIEGQAGATLQRLDIEGYEDGAQAAG